MQPQGVWPTSDASAPRYGTATSVLPVWDNQDMDERWEELLAAAEDFIDKCEPGLCCEFCEPGQLGTHREGCPVPRLEDAAAALKAPTR